MQTSHYIHMGNNIHNSDIPTLTIRDFLLPTRNPYLSVMEINKPRHAVLAMASEGPVTLTHNLCVMCLASTCAKQPAVACMEGRSC